MEPTQSAEYERNSAATMPRREPGVWMDSRWEDATKAGCRTCGWMVVGPYQDVRQQWVDHQHDPLVDIEERVAEFRLTGKTADNLTMQIDIEYLLWRLDQATHNDG